MCPRFFSDLVRSCVLPRGRQYLRERGQNLGLLDVGISQRERLLHEGLDDRVRGPIGSLEHLERRMKQLDRLSGVALLAQGLGNIDPYPQCVGMLWPFAGLEELQGDAMMLERLAVVAEREQDTWSGVDNR